MAEQLLPVMRKVAVMILYPGADSGHLIARHEAKLCLRVRTPVS